MMSHFCLNHRSTVDLNLDYPDDMGLHPWFFSTGLSFRGSPLAD